MAIVTKMINGNGPYKYRVVYKNGKHKWEYLGKVTTNKSSKSNIDENNPENNEFSDFIDRNKLNEEITNQINNFEGSEDIKVERVLAFGSSVRGDAKPGESDLDIMLVVSNPNGDELSPQYDMRQQRLQNHIENNSSEILDNSDTSLVDMDVIAESKNNASIRLNDKLSKNGKLDYEALDVKTGEKVKPDDID